MPVLPWTPQRHRQVLVAVVTFCLGLVLVWLTVVWWKGGAGAGGGLSLSDPLVALGAVALAATLFYLLLRGDEGDFRALFLTALVLFVGHEVLSYLTLAYGALNFRVLAALLAFATGIYAALALAAAACDTPEVTCEAGHRLGFAACLAMLALAMLRGLANVLKGSGDRFLELAGLLVLVAAAAYLLAGLLRSYRRRAGGLKAPE